MMASAASLEVVAEGFDAAAAPTRPVSGIRIALILLGALVALPAFVMGAKLNAEMGTLGSILGSLGGGLILACISSAAAVAGARSRLSSYELIIQAFGTAGGKVVNAVLSIVMVGWFGVVAALFGHAVTQSSAALSFMDPRAWTAVGCVVMTITTIVGFRALDVLSIITVPLKILLLVLTVGAAWARFSHGPLWAPAGATGFSIADGVSFVTGGVIVGALLSPDVARFASSKLQAALACFIAFAVGLPLVLVLSGIPARLTGQSDLILIMVQVGLGLPAILIVMLAAWSSNAYNLYAITLVYRTLAARTARWRLAAFGGAFGGAMGVLGIADQLVPYLVILGIGIPPIAGVYIGSYYFAWARAEPAATKAWRAPAFIAWAIGVAFAAAEAPFRFTMTSVVALDSLLVSTAVFVLLRLALSGRRGRPAVA